MLRLMSNLPIRFALHGGAGDLPPGQQDTREQEAVLRRVAEAAVTRLRAGATAADVVEAAVAALEDCPLFNAGTGAVLNADGVPELDAAIMRGSDRAFGAVTGVSRLRNPVHVARRLLDGLAAGAAPALLAGSGAERYARAQGFLWVDPESLVIAERRSQLADAQARGAVTLDHDQHYEAATGPASGGFGTVGAVARDMAGQLAAATSTGGLTNKHPGRIGDSPVIGAGTFADDRSVAVSCTGTGEAFIRVGFAHFVHARMLGGGISLPEACGKGLDELRHLGGRGGCIAIDRAGEVALPFNSRVMYRAWCDASGEVRVAVGPAAAA